MPMTSLASDIADLMVANGLGIKVGAGADLFGNNMPATPDNVTGIYETVGFEPERVMRGIALEKLNLQLLIRNVNTEVGRAKAEAAFAVLDGFKGLIGNVRYAGILARHSPFPIGADENRRERWSTNYIVWRERS